MALFDTQHFSVHLLKQDQKADPEYNYGVLNKEHNVFDVQTNSEAAAIMLCEQHNYEKQRRIDEQAEDAASSAMKVVHIKPKDVH